MSFLEQNESLWVPEPNTGCLIWLGYIRKGYAATHTRIDGKQKNVSRIVLEERVGPPPTNKHGALHSTLNGCIGGACVNPSHLRWGDQKENAADEPAEKRSDWMRRANASRTIEVRRASLDKARAILSVQTSEQHSERIRKANASRTPEQRSEIMRKAWATRRRNQNV